MMGHKMNFKMTSTKMGEGSQKLQTSGYEINQSWSISYSMVTIVNPVLYF